MINFNLSPEHIAQFHADGFTIVDQLIDGDTVALLRERFERLFAGEYETGLMPDEVNWRADRDSQNAMRQICNAWKADRAVAAVVLDAAVGKACATLANWPGARINQDNLFWKPPGGTALGFHQDASYEQWITPSEMISCWIALDDTSVDGGSVEYVRGSHQWGAAQMIEAFHQPDDPLKEMRNAAAAAGIAAPECVPVIVAAGGAAFHHGRVWHGSRANQRSTIRRSLVAHCMSSDSRFSGTQIGPVYSRYQRFNDDSMDESFFPVIWQNNGYRSPHLDDFINRKVGWGGTV